MLVPLEVERGERFGCYTRLAIHTGSRSSRLHRLEVERAHITGAVWMPEFAHREVRMLEVFHDVGIEHIAGSCFVHYGQSVFVSQFSHTAVELVRKKVVDHSSPVQQEARSSFRTVDDISHQSRQPGTEVITSTFAKFAFHLLCPGLRITFPAVEQHTIQHTALEGTVCQMTDVAGKVSFRSFGRKFVAFPTCSCRRSRIVLSAFVYMAETEDGPSFIGRSFPRELAIGSHVLGDVAYLVGVQIGSCTLHQIVGRTFKGTQVPGSFTFPAVLAGSTPELDAVHAHAIFVVYFHPASHSLLHFRTGKGHRVTVLPAAWRQVGIYDGMLASIGQQCIGSNMEVRFERHGMVQALYTRKLYGTDGGRRLELHFYPMRFSLLGRRKVYIRLLFFHQFTPREVSVTFHLCPFQWLAGVTFRSREGQYGYVAIVSPFFLVRFGYSQLCLDVLACYIRTAIDNGAHRVFRLDPRSARHRPSRAVLHGESQS